MSGYLARLLAGAVHPQRAVRPLLGALFGRPSAGPEWLLRASRPPRAKVEGGVDDAERIFDDGAEREDSPAAMPAPSPRFAAAGATRAGAVDPVLRDPGIRVRTLHGDGRSDGDTGRGEAHAQAAGAQAAGAAAGEDALERQPGVGHAGNEAHEHERERERAAAPRDATRENAAPDDGRAPLPDRWRARRPSTEILRLDQASAEPDPGTAVRSAPRSAPLTPSTGEGDMPERTAVPVQIARLPPHRDSEIDLIQQYAPHPYHGSSRRAIPEHNAHPPRVAEAMTASEAMAAVVRPASPAQSPSGRDTGNLRAAARRARPAASEPAQRHGMENRGSVQNRYGVELRRADPEPTVHVTIGTVEIKAGARSTPPRPRPASPAVPRVGLTEYLRRRRTGDPS
jgi:hypothetical protein